MGSLGGLVFRDLVFDRLDFFDEMDLFDEFLTFDRVDDLLKKEAIRRSNPMI
jgi:hypothetical protein